MFRLVKSPPCPTIARFGSCGGITLIGTQGSHIEARPLATEISWPQGDPELALGTENCSLAADDSSLCYIPTLKKVTITEEIYNVKNTNKAVVSERMYT